LPITAVERYSFTHSRFPRGM